MIVVADTSPIVYLVLIDQVELLASFYGEVLARLRTTNFFVVDGLIEELFSNWL